MPWELDHVMEPELAHKGVLELDPIRVIEKTLIPEPKQAFHKVSTLHSLHTRNQLLKDADWASMAHSLEVRFPLVDGTLLKQCAPWNAGSSRNQSKQVLRQSPKTPLPNSIDKDKTGFSVPIEQWIEQLPSHSATRILGNISKRSHWSRRWALIVQTLVAQRGEHLL